ncbi:hypothetical protein I3271_05440 [Photobacterium leiognathi]|uniref:hypothetical protein n=1 Tax=Photobacterium leiognathi TaxID=553611 RepID=UPI001EE01837|nr:hypothetical protein [Photobacterium leiognathi]MCG3884124.1 hypothetical protein [Photobacterium leiognathi]
MTDKRIFVVSLSSNEPMSLLAGYRDGQLHIVECKPLPRSLATLKKKLPERLINLKDKGFITLVDEVIPVFSRYARSLKLSDIGNDGRPVLVSALQTYRNMVNLQAITFPRGDSGAFDISESIVEERRDANGGISYHIDWSELRAESTLLLLAISAAMQDSLLDSCTATSLLKQLGASQESRAFSNPFDAITRKYDRQFLSVDALGVYDE